MQDPRMIRMPDGSIAQIVPYCLDRHEFYGTPRRPTFLPVYPPRQAILFSQFYDAARKQLPESEAQAMARCFTDHTIVRTRDA